MTDERVVVERRLLGAMMMSRRYAEIVASRVAPDDWSVPVHAAGAEAIATLTETGRAATPLQVANVVDGLDVEHVARWLDAVEDLGHYQAADVEILCDRVVDAAAARRLTAYATRIVEQLSSPAADPRASVEWAREQLEYLDLPTPADGPENVDEFLARAPDPEWIVDGVVARLDRLLIVATEGGGKSTWLRQNAMMISQGIHPWMLYRRPPRRVLFVDLENPPMLVRQQVAGLRETAIAAVGGDYDPERLRIVCRPEGIDVTQRRDAWWLMRLVASARPDLLIVGPVYKLHESEEEKSSDVRQVLKVLDLIRTRWNCAVWMETHAPHESFNKDGVLRPAGSRLWIRWPEFVLTLSPRSRNAPNGEWILGHARPPRDQRTWPRAVTRGGDAWPWTTETL